MPCIFHYSHSCWVLTYRVCLVVCSGAVPISMYGSVQGFRFMHKMLFYEMEWMQSGSIESTRDFFQNKTSLSLMPWVAEECRQCAQSPSGLFSSQRMQLNNKNPKLFKDILCSLFEVVEAFVKDKSIKASFLFIKLHSWPWDSSSLIMVRVRLPVSKLSHGCFPSMNLFPLLCLDFIHNLTSHNLIQ